MLVEKFQRLVVRYTRIRNKKYYNIIKDHLTNVLCILDVGKNVWVKLEKKIIISCNIGTLLFYTLISSNTTLRYMFAQGRTDERGAGQKGYTGCRQIKRL